jgi:hypothetical protein
MRRRDVDRTIKFKAPTGPGRPRVHTEAWAKVSVVLFARQVLHLDKLAQKARQRGHKTFTRASLIRGLIDGMIDSGHDASLHETEAQLRAHVAKRLKSGG